MAGKAGELLKKAREDAKLTQEQTVRKANCNLTARELGEAERGLRDLTQTQLKKLAGALGVTQRALLDAAKADKAAAEKAKSPSAALTASRSASKASPAAKKSSAAKKTAASKASSEKKSSGTKKTASDELMLTAAEKKLVELYRAADKNTKDEAMRVLRGDPQTAQGGNFLGDLLSSSLSSGAGNVLSELANAAADKIFGGK